MYINSAIMYYKHSRPRQSGYDVYVHYGIAGLHVFMVFSHSANKYVNKKLQNNKAVSPLSYNDGTRQAIQF